MNSFLIEFSYCTINVTELILDVVLHILILQVKNKEATINPKNEDDKCFQYVVTVLLKYEEIKQNPQRLFNIKPFINKYKRKGINYPSKIDDQ